MIENIKVELELETANSKGAQQSISSFFPDFSERDSKSA
jgi:hypothetical protein